MAGEKQNFPKVAYERAQEARRKGIKGEPKKETFTRVEYERAQAAIKKAELELQKEERRVREMPTSAEPAEALKKSSVKDAAEDTQTAEQSQNYTRLVPVSDSGKEFARTEEPKQEKPQPKKKERIQVAFVETTQNVEDRAKDVAEARLNASKEQLRGIKGFFVKAWKHNYFYDIYRQREIERAKKEIFSKKNLFADEGEDTKAHSAAYESVIKQFTHERAEDLMHREAGEAREVLGNETEGDKKIKAKIKEAVEKYAMLDLTDPEVRKGFEHENDLIIQELVSEKDKVPGSVLEESVHKQRAFANNLEQTVRLVQEKIKEGAKLSELDLDFNIVVGRARSSVRTEAQRTAVDKTLETIGKNKLGALLINEMGLGVAVAAAYSVGGTGLQRILSSRSAALMSLGGTALAAGAIAGVRESRRIKMDRAQHARQMAMGGTVGENSPRREEMEKSRYETKHAGLLQNKLQETAAFITPEHLKDVSPEVAKQRFSMALDALGEIERRSLRSDQEKIDLIEFTDAKSVGQERFALDVARAEAKVALRKALADNPALAESFGTLDSALESRMKAQDGTLQEDIDKKDALYKKIRFKNIKNAALIGAGTGLVGGVIAQEALAFLNPNQLGALEHAVDSIRGKNIGTPGDVTPLESLRLLVTGGGGGGGHALVGGPATGWMGGTCMRMPAGFSIAQNAQGTYDLLKGGSSVAHGLTMDSGGHLSDASKEILTKQGIALTDNPTPGFNTNPTPERIAHEYKERGLMKDITRKLWYDNNTPQFDKNELRTWWGGPGNKGVDTNGNFSYTVKHMTPDGSYHGSEKVDAQQFMKDGKLKMLFSLSRGTQNTVFEIPINADGTVTIDKNSDAGRMLFKVGAGGQAEFLGAFGEIVHSVGKAKDGTDLVQVLSTHVGSDKAQMPLPCKDIVVTVPDNWSPRVMPPPFVMPFAPRTPLEPIGKKQKIDTNGQKESVAEAKREKIAPKQELASNKRPGYGAITDLRGKVAIENKRGTIAIEDKRFVGEIEPAVALLNRLLTPWKEEMQKGSLKRADEFINTIGPEAKKRLADLGRRLSAQKKNLNEGQYKRLQEQTRGFKKELNNLSSHFGTPSPNVQADPQAQSRSKQEKGAGIRAERKLWAFEQRLQRFKTALDTKQYGGVGDAENEASLIRLGVSVFEMRNDVGRMKEIPSGLRKTLEERADLLAQNLQGVLARGEFDATRRGIYQTIDTRRNKRATRAGNRR